MIDIVWSHPGGPQVVTASEPARMVCRHTDGRREWYDVVEYTAVTTRPANSVDLEQWRAERDAI